MPFAGTSVHKVERSLRWAGNDAVSGTGNDGPRRQPNTDVARSKRYVVKVTTDDRDRLESKAHLRNVTVARLLVESALLEPAQQREATMPTAGERQAIVAGLFRLERLALSAANNVNQIARYAHEVRGFPAGAEEALITTRRLVERIDEFLREFGLESRRAKRSRSKARSADPDAASQTEWSE